MLGLGNLCLQWLPWRPHVVEVMTRTSFPLVCAIFYVKLLVFQVFKNIGPYGESMKENNVIISGMVEDIKRALIVE